MTDRVDKFVASLDVKMRAKLKERLLKLKKDPFAKSVDVKMLKGVDGDIYRLRMGKIRVLFMMVDGEVKIVDIDYRGNIY